MANRRLISRLGEINLTGEGKFVRIKRISGETEWLKESNEISPGKEGNAGKSLFLPGVPTGSH